MFPNVESLIDACGEYESEDSDSSEDDPLPPPDPMVHPALTEARSPQEDEGHSSGSPVKLAFETQQGMSSISFQVEISF